MIKLPEVTGDINTEPGSYVDIIKNYSKWGQTFLYTEILRATTVKTKKQLSDFKMALSYLVKTKHLIQVELPGSGLTAFTLFREYTLPADWEKLMPKPSPVVLSAEDSISFSSDVRYE